MTCNVHTHHFADRTQGFVKPFTRKNPCPPCAKELPRCLAQRAIHEALWV